MTIERGPVDDPVVAAVLTAASAPAEAPLPGEAAALAAFRAHHEVAAAAGTRRLRGPRTKRRTRLVAAAVFGGAVMISGAAAAATGSLPLLPSHHDHPSKPAPHQQPTGPTDGGVQQGTDNSNRAPDAGTASPHGKGGDISDLARSPGPAGRDKGKTVCTAASEEKCGSGGSQRADERRATHPDKSTQTHGAGGANRGAATHESGDGHTSDDSTTTPRHGPATPHPALTRGAPDNG